MAIPDTIWEVTVTAGWFTAATAPPEDEPRSLFVSKYHLNSSVPGANVALANQLSQFVRASYTFTVLKLFWAEWVWFLKCETKHLNSGIEGINASAQRLGKPHVGGSKDLPLNAAAFVFGRAAAIDVQTRQWFAGLNSTVLAADGTVDWAGHADFLDFVRQQMGQRVIGARTYTRVVYSQATETIHPIAERIRVKEFRSIRRRSLTGAESYEPL